MQSIADQLVTIDFTEWEERYDSLDWRVYKEMSAIERFMFHTYLINKDIKNGTGNKSLQTEINRLSTRDEKITVSLRRGSDVRYFSNCKSAGEFLNTSPNKISANYGKEVLGWTVTKEYAEVIIRESDGEVLELLNGKYDHSHYKVS